MRSHERFGLQDPSKIPCGGDYLSATGYKTFLGNYSGAGGGGGTIEGSLHKNSVLKANDSVNLAHHFFFQIL